ncbi:hypothetical protein PENTCL1PPCAC_2917 [Pristionchus entomophagus]|uniref:non-specific serine/threonine protein kinase n=1 Tax=Pristionchus entomophagus TaxID=358040 RepID=A0AAV5SBQ1_9BILA|nr:hypothetical protein PENTCL1PPCAC_2917 [Pristionchus entomophagus]
MVVNEKLREIKIGITSVVAKKWIMNRKLGEGAFGIVFECYSVPNPSVKRALKAEIIGVDASHESLKMEIYVMRKMMSVNAAHSVQLFGAGTERNYNYVVMTLLGISLSDIRKRLPDEKFSLDSLIVIGIQSTDSLKELHSAGFVHRDIKPSNYTVGKEQTDWLYLIDFGICREIMYTEDLQTKLKCPRRNCQFRGTTRYCSINAHKRKELGRHDDLLSMMYMLFEGHAGSLPWKHKDRLMTEKLKSEKEEEMLSSAPKPFVKAYEYLRELTYFLTPDYKRIRNEFLMMAEERNLTPPYKLDWDAIVNHPGAAPQPPGKMGKEQLMNPPDISTLYDVPDEFPHEESCSDSDRTIPSERHPQPSVYRTEEQTQTDETSQMQGGKGKASPYSEPSAPATPKVIFVVCSLIFTTILQLVDVPTLPKAEKKKEEKREEPRKERDEKKDERREEKKERKEEKREEHRKLKDDSTKKREIPKKDESGKVKVEKPETQAARTPLLATAPTPVATTPATAATAATVTAATTKEAKEVHVEAFHPLKKTECSMRRKERSEMRKKRREARGAKTPAKKAVKTPSKGTKKVRDQR